jgi:hypothetical protein
VKVHRSHLMRKMKAVAANGISIANSNTSSGSFLAVAPARQPAFATGRRLPEPRQESRPSVGSGSILTKMPSRPGEFHPEPLTEPDLILSHHTARIADLEGPSFISRTVTHPPCGPALLVTQAE